jgi:small lipoprotein (TIGR04452 family)
MKPILLILLCVSILSCSSYYSPSGIKGSDAKKQIDDAKTEMGLITLPMLNQNLSSLNTGDVTCTLDSNSVSTFAGNTGAANFSIPSEVGTSIDLNATGAGYFRSQSFSTTNDNMSIYIQRIIGSGTCTFSYNSNICGTAAIGTGTQLGSTLLSYSVINGDCLAFNCSGAATIRVRLGASNEVTYTSNLTDLILGPEIFNSLTGIEDSTYYTKESVELCKEGITQIGILNAGITSNAMNQFVRVDYPQYSKCNRPFPRLNSPSTMTISALQADSCKLEKEKILGVL